MYKALKQFGFFSFNILNLCFLVILIPAAFAGAVKLKPPVIPEISTLPGPQSVDLTKANKYISDDFLPSLAMTVIKLAIPLSVVFLIIGAIQFISALGNTEKLSLAKKTVSFSLLGLIISLLSYAIVQLIFYSGYQITTIQ